ncbi:hypothetical protein M9Y10_037924 [Tritrichomonas musculus]|uniref:sn-1-specific diacylglycerol lipase n=1 Tax=Tritrichomonas musculus TaxID=1915356 RepID=A0ABR2K7M8_9EUKA
MKKVLNSIKQKAKAISFDKDPTHEVDSLSSAFIWKTIFSRLPSTLVLDPSELPSDEVIQLLHCAILSREIYKDPSRRFLPPNLSNIVYECSESDYYRIPYFVINSDDLDIIFVVCRGSYCFKDFFVDFMAATVSYRGGQVHEGVFLTANNLFNSAKTIIRRLSEVSNNRKVIFTGHSLGGAVAAMCTEMFNAEMHDIDVKCVCFAPVASFTQDIWEISRSYIRTYILDGDFVPFISYYNAVHLPHNALPSLFRNQLNKAIQKRINKHAHQPEFQDIIRSQTDVVDEPYQLFPPGNAFLFKLVNEKEGIIEVQKINDHMRYFGQFVKELNELRHMMKVYRRWIIKYTVDFFKGDDELIDYYDLDRKKTKKMHKLKKRKSFDIIFMHDQFDIEEPYFWD